MNEIELVIWDSQCRYIYLLREIIIYNCWPDVTRWKLKIPLAVLLIVIARIISHNSQACLRTVLRERFCCTLHDLDAQNQIRPSSIVFHRSDRPSSKEKSISLKNNRRDLSATAKCTRITFLKKFAWKKKHCIYILNK